MTSDSFTRQGQPTRVRQPTRDRRSSGVRRRTTGSGRAQPSGAGFTVVAVLSIAITAALLISALVYYLGSPGRIAGDYTSVASPANQALGAELASFAKDRNSDLAAAKSDLMREATTISSFNVLLGEVTFPAAAASASRSLIFADDRLHKLIQVQAQAHSLGEMQALEAGADLAAVNVKIQVARIRRALGLPPASGPLY